MSENNTEEMNGARPLLERILMRLDSIDARLDSMDNRLSALEDKAERQAMETKPVWERALAEIAETRMEIREGFESLERKIDILNRELLQVKADQARIDGRVDRLEQRRQEDSVS